MAEALTLPDPDEDAPAGPNLESDPAFGEMERAAQGRTESQYGSTIEEATPPDWRQAAALAEALLGRTRDLRVMVLLAIARVNLADLPGFAAVLATLRQHLDTMWDGVHPRLDPEDDPPNDPTQRANALQQLVDAGRMLRPLRDVPLATPPRMKPVTWRDMAILSGAIEAEPGREKMTEAGIRGAFAATDKQRLATLHTALDDILAELAGISAAFDTHAGYGTGPELEALPKLVREIRNEVVRHEAMALDSAPPEEVADGAPADAPEDGEPGAAPRPRAARSFASIRSIAALDSREDALHALSLAAAFFRMNEPSSPLPLLIERAVRLAPLPFMDILRDLAPDGLMQAQTIAGPQPE